MTTRQFTREEARAIGERIAQAVGHAARERVRTRFLPPHFLGGHLAVIDRILREVLR